MYVGKVRFIVLARFEPELPRAVRPVKETMWSTWMLLYAECKDGLRIAAPSHVQR